METGIRDKGQREGWAAGKNQRGETGRRGGRYSSSPMHRKNTFVIGASENVRRKKCRSLGVRYPWYNKSDARATLPTLANLHSPLPVRMLQHSAPKTSEKTTRQATTPSPPSISLALPPPSPTHRVRESEMYKEERGVLEEETREIDEHDMEEFGTLDGSEKTIAILGDRWWQAAKQEGAKISKRCLRNICKQPAPKCRRCLY